MKEYINCPWPRFLSDVENKLLVEVDKLKGELTRKDEDLAKTTKSFKQDVA